MSRGLALIAATLCSAGCEESLPPRAQLVLHIDTDVTVPALADTLLIEHLAPDGTTIEERQHVLPNPSDWPVSIGIVPRDDGAPTRLRLRLRLFPAARAALTGISLSPDAGTAGVAVPRDAFVIDRVVELTPPARGIAHVRVLLAGACLGIPADPATPRSCAALPGAPATFEAPATEAVEPIPDAPVRGQDSLVGTWIEAQEVPCSGEPRPDTGIFDGETCIPGGVFFIGDDRQAHNHCTPYCDPAPERLVRMSPYWLDTYEVTVGRWRAAMARGFTPPRGGYLTSNTTSICLYSRTDVSRESHPMNCVTWETARAFCEFEGRVLASEAQLEYAASGRGAEHVYPWGDAIPTCAHAAYARIGLREVERFPGIPYTPGQIGTLTECGDVDDGPPPVGTAALDVSRDGVHDLAGSMREWALDQTAFYDQECWAQPVLRDPVCTSGPDSNLHTQRGGSWAHTSAVLAVTWRDGRDDTVLGTGGSFLGFMLGFRCARSAVP